jgi:hypothetical protein
MKYNTNNVQVHVDYVLAILKENVKELFRASKQIEQPCSHRRRNNNHYNILKQIPIMLGFE